MIYIWAVIFLISALVLLFMKVTDPSPPSLAERIAKREAEIKCLDRYLARLMESDERTL